MSSRFLQVRAVDIFNSERKSEDVDDTHIIVHISEMVVHNIVVKELKDRAGTVVKDIARAEEEISEEAPGPHKDFLMRDLEVYKELLTHLNYLRDFFGEENPPEL